MTQNRSHDSGVKSATKFVRTILGIIGAWSVESRVSAVQRIIKIFVITVCYALLQSVLIPSILYLIVFAETGRAKLKLTPPILYGIMAVMNYTYLLIRKSQIRKCLKHIEEDWNCNEEATFRDIMKESVAMGKRLFLVCGLLIYASGFAFRTILPLSKGSHVNSQNVTIRPLALPGYYVWFDVQATPAYEIVFTVQTASGFVTFSIIAGICGMAIVFVMHTCGQLNILILLMEDLVTADKTVTVNIDKKLALLVDHQIRIRHFLTLIENTLQHMCLVKVTVCTLIMSMIGYMMILEWKTRNFLAILTYVMVLASIGSILFMICHIGEQLSVQAEKVAVKSSILDWHRLPEKKARAVVLIMAASNSPMRITAGKLLDLSYETFGAIVRTALAYWQMLLTMNE